MDEVIIYIKIFKLKALKIEDIWLFENSKVDKITSSITYQANYKDEDLNINLKA